jgi:hypothetical protein
MKTSSHAMLCCLVAGALASHAVAQRTWVVDRIMGPGVDYTDIPPAIAAAAPWDRIEVRGSTPLAPTYSPFLVDKPLDIEATQGASVFWFRVENLTTGQVVRVAGVHCEPRPSWGLPDEAVIVRNCTGTVLLANLNVWTRTADFLPGFIVRDAAAVAIQGCTVSGRSAGLTTGGPAVVAERSGVSIVASVLTGGDGGGSASSAAGYDGGTGLDVLGGSVFAASSTIEGGDGAYGWAHSGDGGDAVVVGAALPSRVTIAGCTLSRGAGVVNGDAVNGIARITQDCVLTGALVSGAVSVPPITMLTATPSLAVGTPAVVTITGTTGTLCIVGFDLRHGHQALPGIAEPLLLSPSLAVGTIVTLAGAQFVWTLPIPNSPLLAQRDLFFQAAAAPSTGGITLTPLAVTRMQ